jgi:hypothetical protein
MNGCEMKDENFNSAATSAVGRHSTGTGGAMK